MPIYKKKRLDQLLVDSGLAPTRSRAADLVRRGLVSVAGITALKPGVQVAADAELRSARGRAAMFPAADKSSRPRSMPSASTRKCTMALDVGASTGGFTDVLIARGAAKIYAVDVGRGQLHAKLRVNPRVVALEGTDARALDRQVIREEVTAIVADVSFIGLTLALPAALKPRRARRLAGGSGQAAIRGGPGGGRQRRHCPERRRAEEGCGKGARLHRGAPAGPSSARSPRRFSAAAATRNS